MNITREQAINRIVNLQYERSDFGFHRGTFRVRGGNKGGEILYTGIPSGISKIKYSYTGQYLKDL